MSRKFEVVVTDEMVKLMQAGDSVSQETAIRWAVESKDFRAQLRAWAAEEMRGLVPETYAGSHPSLLNEYESGHWEACAETLANIERWEQSHENP